MILLEKPAESSREEVPAGQTRFQADYSGSLCGRLNDKWTVVVLWRISAAPAQRIRFSALKKEIDGVTQRMLTLTLRNLERDGLVLRHLFPEVPPRVEYELTDLGGSLLTALQSVNRWMIENMPQVKPCRRAYDAVDKSSVNAREV